MYRNGTDTQAEQDHAAAEVHPAQTSPSGQVEGSPGGVPPGQVNPAAMTVQQVSQLLTAAGAKRADAETIRRHLAAGAPVSAAATINLMHYMAWLMREVSHGEE